MTTQALTLPPPIQGQNDRIALAALQNPYCEFVQNFKPELGIMKVKKGDLKYATVVSTTFVSTLGSALFTYQKADGSESLFAAYTDGITLQISDITAGGVGTNVYNTGFSIIPSAVHSVNFKGITFFPISATGLFQYNGTAWATSTYTFPSTYGPTSGTVHKNRIFFTLCNPATSQYPIASYAYTELEAVTGATIEVDLSGITSQKGYLLGIRSISLSEGIQQENVAAFVFSTGEVLVYSGSYPDSPTWQIVGRFFIPRPVYRLNIEPFVDAKGDSFVVTEIGPISLRTLFTQGATLAIEEGIGAAIKDRWSQVVKAIQANSYLNQNNVRGVFDQKRNRLVFSFSRYADRTGTLETKALFLIYDFRLQCWYEYVANIFDSPVDQSQVFTPAYFNSTVVYSTNTKAVMTLEGATDYMDDDTSGNNVAIVYRLRSAPMPTQKTGITLFKGLEPIVKTDLYASTEYQAIGNFGGVESGFDLTEGDGVLVSKTFADVSLDDCTYVQYDIDGDTTALSTIGYELYGMNVWVAPGTGRFR